MAGNPNPRTDHLEPHQFDEGDAERYADEAWQTKRRQLLERLGVDVEAADDE